MSARTSLIVIGVPIVLGLAACQSLQSDRQALQIVPAEQIRHGTARPEALYAVGRYHQGQIRYDKAIDAYQQLLTEYPDHAEAHNALGIIFAIQGSHDGAIVEFEKAALNAPNSASIRNNLGYAYMLRGRVDEAIAVLNIAAQLDPANQRVRDNLDIALARGGKGGGDTPPSAVGTDERAAPVPAPVEKSAALPNKMQLIAVADNVFALQLPPRTSGKASVPASEPAGQSPGQTPPGWAEAGGPATGGKGMRLEVSNGNGVSSLARKTSTHLEGAGYAKVRLTNELPYRLLATEIQYRPGYELQARDLQASLRAGIPLVPSERLRADVKMRLLLGKDVKTVTEVVAQAPSAPPASQLAAVVP